MHTVVMRALSVMGAILFSLGEGLASAKEPLVIAASPSLVAPLEALGRAFEATHPDVTVRLYLNSGLDIRQTIAAMQNTSIGQYFIGKGPIHIIAPGGDELITRLEQRYYVLPNSRKAYATEPLVLVVPESLADAPESFEALAHNAQLRVAIADPTLTSLGQKSGELLKRVGIADSLKARLDVAADARGVLNHLLNGNADVGIVFGPDAVEEGERVRVVAVSDEGLYKPTLHSMAMERYCPNRNLCQEFLAFIQSSEAQSVLKRLGYGSPLKP
ncbi:MAG: molybdate ABC transporter substrate-binding protein [Nitrospirales bacterium]|nr:molybdate ABC transporter substrate-binding protein [Nitrospirales bacterium]